MDKVDELTQIVKAVQDDRKNFEQLYPRIVNKVYFWCYTIVGNEADALDASQEAILCIYKKIDTLKNPPMFNSWMYRVVTNSCYRYLRDNKKKDYNFSDLSNPNFSAGFEETIKEKRIDGLPKESYDLQETKQLVLKFVEALPKKQKEVIILHYLEEFKIEEIAQILDYNVGSIKSRLHAGRKSLKTKVAEYQEKNNVKLYSLALLPLLSLFLREYRNEICSKQNLEYKPETYKMGTHLTTGNLASILTNKLFIGGIVSFVIIVIIGLQYLNLHSNPLIDNIDLTYMDDLEIVQTINKDSNIETISYLGFPARTSVNVSIDLKEDEEAKDISIMLDDKKMTFQKIGKTIYIEVSENGFYIVDVDGKKTEFEIGIIDKYAPELVEVRNHGTYLQLLINDEHSQIDYKKSYIEYNGSKYKINNMKQVEGVFKNNLSITIFNKEDKYITYDIDLK